jgi:hypothetical protein
LPLITRRCCGRGARPETRAPLSPAHYGGVRDCESAPAPDASRTACQLRDLGYDEIWLQNWLAASPARLGLGEVRIVAQELTAPRGGSLDILAADGDTYYSVEVQLGKSMPRTASGSLTTGRATACASRARTMLLS